MNGPSDIEKRLSRIRLETSEQEDEQILSDATAEFERAAKVNLPSIRKVLFLVIFIFLIIIAGVIFLLPGEAEQERPQTVPQVTAVAEPIETEIPKQSKVAEAVEVDEPDLPLQSSSTEHAEPVADSVQSRFVRIAEYAKTGDVNSLVAELDTNDIIVKLAAVNFLLNMTDERAVAALDELAGQLDPNDPKDYLLVELLGVEDLEQVEESPEKTEAEAKTEEANEPNMPVVKEEKPPVQYVAGWLIDVNGYVIEGEIQVGGQKAATDSNGAFSIERPSFTDFISSFGYAVSADGNLGTVFHWDEDEDINDIEIMCMAFASASGNVVDVNGQAVGELQMEIAPYLSEEKIYSEGKLKGPWQIIVDANGIFEVTSIPVGYPLALVVSAEGNKAEISLDEPEPAEHLLLGEIVLEAMEEAVEEEPGPGGG
jgi:hypothetical protein